MIDRQLAHPLNSFRAALGLPAFSRIFRDYVHFPRRAMAQDGRVEMVVPEADSACFSKLLGLNTSVMTGGRERTEREFRALLDASNYRLRRIIPTIAPQSIIEAIPT